MRGWWSAPHCEFSADCSPTCSIRWQDENKPLRVADIQQELSRREVPTMTESLPSGMPPGLSRRLTMTPMELVYESAIQYITSRNPASLLRTMGGSLSRTVTRLSTLATTYGPISLCPSLRAGSLRGMSWVDNQTFCLQPYHPVAQDWLPTEAKQGWAGQYLDGRPPGKTRLLLEEVLVRTAGGAHPAVCVGPNTPV